MSVICVHCMTICFCKTPKTDTAILHLSMDPESAIENDMQICSVSSQVHQQ
jgi:hypothetical protein